MRGIHLSSLSQELHHVAEKFADKPVESIEVGPKLDFCQGKIESSFESFSFEKDYYKLPLNILRNFSFDELCKMKYSTCITMDKTVSDLFEESPEHEIVRKIMSSMWRWGYGKGTWNEVVDAWNCIRRFSLGLGPDFDVRLDHTTYYNEIGYSKYAREFLDGVFAFLVYHKGKHVMTIGFSVVEGRRILIQQVQLKERSGNRWLYKLPANRLEFVLDRFASHFPGFDLLVVDGKSLVQKILANYERGLQRARERVSCHLVVNAPHSPERERDERDLSWWEERTAHVRNDANRLADFYKNVGRYVLGARLEINKVLHYQLEI